jgi:hypothetical protein
MGAEVDDASDQFLDWRGSRLLESDKVPVLPLRLKGRFWLLAADSADLADHVGMISPVVSI